MKSVLICGEKNNRKVGIMFFAVNENIIRESVDLSNVRFQIPKLNQ